MKIEGIVKGPTLRPWAKDRNIYQRSERDVFIYVMRFQYGDRVLVKAGRTHGPKGRFDVCGALAAWKFGSPNVRGMMRFWVGSHAGEGRLLRFIERYMDPIGNEWFSPRANSRIRVRSSRRTRPYSRSWMEVLDDEQRRRDEIMSRRRAKR